MSGARPPVEILLGSAPGAVRGIEGDFALMDAGTPAARTRVWTCTETAVVLGVSRDADTEIDLDVCQRSSAAVLRRASGGGTVVIGSGTVQYALVVPHASGEPPPSLEQVKQRCNGFVRAALAACGLHAEIDSDPSGDLRIGDRKVGGLALRRQRTATMLHGTLLVEADLDLVATLLHHPGREPAWRRGRTHLDFLANTGALDHDAFARSLAAAAWQR
ncbi:MAG TPA: hypothetical protein VGK20_01000 [Candidatus Binatia bacterium]|jgi:lipoate-protein ligase A